MSAKAQGPTTADLERPDQIRSVRCTDERLAVDLMDERRVSVPLWWYPRLLHAPPAQRARFEIGRFGSHWLEIDEDLELAGLLLGAKVAGATSPAES